MTTTHRRSSRDGLSVQTLVIAALASAAAAIVTSTFWRGGTIVTAAMTPVIVSIVKELLARPIESDLVRRPVQRVRTVAPAAGARRFQRQEQGRVPVEAGARGRAVRGGERPYPAGDVPRPTPGDRALGTGPVRTYGRRRKLRIGLALATGVVAFAVALVALTVPELIFGGSVVSKGGTTFFGGRTEKTATTPRQQTPTGTSPTSTSPTTSPQQTGPQTSTSPNGQTAPSDQPPSQRAPPAQQQAPPSQQAPAPSPGGTPPGK
jgi:hypothetical protein